MQCGYTNIPWHCIADSVTGSWFTWLPAWIGLGRTTAVAPIAPSITFSFPFTCRRSPTSGYTSIRRLIGRRVRNLHTFAAAWIRPRIRRLGSSSFSFSSGWESR